MEFIELTISENKKIKMNAMLISVLEEMIYDNPPASDSSKTIVHLMGGDKWGVIESVKQIESLIHKRTITTFLGPK